MSVLLHNAVDEAAERTPDAPAFRFLRDEISYGALAEKSAKLAAVLMQNGVRKGDRVGLYLNKSLETAISIFGVMKAGAAYVPLDPMAPPERTRAVMRECGMRALITHAPKAKDAGEILAAGVDGALTCIIGADHAETGKAVSIAWDEINNAKTAPRPALLEGDPAYIIFTSGSTGAPKGILHTHQSGLAYAKRAAALYDLRPGDRLSNHSPLHFDMSTFDYLSGSLVGATTVIISEQHAKMPASLSKLIETERLTHWYSVPFALTQLLEFGVLEKRDLSSLRWVMFGGEPFPAKHLSRLMTMLPAARFSNVYGPAEVNQCTHHTVQASDLENGVSPPLGEVWDVAEGLIVGADDKPTSTGEAGELLIRSSTMMRGYWNRPDLNKNAFFEREVSAGIFDRFYRTGDLVRRDEGGVLHFLGRKDRQIKLRGFRIELDEIEAAFLSAPQVKEAAAVVIGGAEDQEIAIALILRDGEVTGEADMLDLVRGKVPSYAMPKSVSIFSSFPRTTSDKIDRRAIAAMLETPNAIQETLNA